jgi:hypothetical protein
LVVEVRLKGSGMHWAREHVDPMVALRNILCSDRWAEAWPQITQTLRQQLRQRRRTRRDQRRQALQPPQTAPAPARPAMRAKPQPEPRPLQAAAIASEPWRPPANHPWRHMPVGRARFNSPRQESDGKT